MSKEKSIDWLVNPDGSSGKTWNPAIGCNNKCIYCYARKIVKRFGMAERMARKEIMYKYDTKNIELDSRIYNDYLNLWKNFYYFNPTFRPSVLAQKLPKKPTMIFFSMSDPAYWEPEWYEKILEKICEHMQHTFVLLTKAPVIYEKYTFPCNTWLGVTITRNSDWGKVAILTEGCHKNITFISYEPIHEKIDNELIDNIITGNWSHYKNDGEVCYHYGKAIDWVICGPETGRRKNRIKATPDMIEPFYDLETRVFMKESCKQITGKKLRQEWPKGYINETR